MDDPKLHHPNLLLLHFLNVQLESNRKPVSEDVKFLNPTKR
jgi:hypothetical protein